MTRYVLYTCVLLAGALAAGHVIVTTAEAQDLESGAVGEFDSDAEAQAAAQADALLATLNALESAALFEADDELRGAAIGEVVLYRHTSAVAILIKAAATDPEPGNRLQAVEALWYSAADGLDTQGTIAGALQAALDDPDEGVSATAGQAIADLAALADSQ